MNRFDTYLIVDDNALDRSYMQRILLREGAAQEDIREFLNGEEIIKFLDTLVPTKTCLLLLDINMPIIDGLEVLRYIEGRKGFLSLKIHVLIPSENCIPPELDESQWSFLVKPITGDKL